MIIFFALTIIITFAIIQAYTMIRFGEIFEGKNEVCRLYGENITSSDYLNDSFIESCECRYENIVEQGMETMCACDCYTDGTVCPRIKNGRCYISVMLTDAGLLGV